MRILKRPALQLNCYLEPLRIITVRRALELVTRGKAVVVVVTNVRVYPGVYAPSVIRLREYAKVPYRIPVVTRRNIITRDGSRCMYCGHRYPGELLELEHVIPRSRGGGKTWDNIVAACRACNKRKDDRTPEEAGMPLVRRPLPATVHTSKLMLAALGGEVREWKKYLWHDSNGDQAYVVRDEMPA